MLANIIAEKKTDSTSLTAWVESVYLASNHDPNLLRQLYRHAAVMFKQERQAMLEELSCFAAFDAYHCCEKVAKSAAAVLSELDKMRGYPDFIDAIKAGQLAGFITDDLLYVVTPSVKPNTPRYQMTTFAKGVGPIADALRETPEEFISLQFGLPRSARFVDEKAILAVERKYCNG
ncbi:hypothetical protein ACV4QK_21030 (plasmid) [Alteromonas macleodii]